MGGGLLRKDNLMMVVVERRQQQLVSTGEGAVGCVKVWILGGKKAALDELRCVLLFLVLKDDQKRG